MREFQISTFVDASLEKVWQLMADVEAWPQWTAAITRIELLTSPPLGISSRVRIYQPRLRPAIWTVTVWEPHQQFIWVSKMPGLAVTGEHAVAPSNGGCTITLRARFAGFLGNLAAFLTRNLSTQY